jgi:hypothetical protein
MIDCDWIGAIAPELALGLVVGRERAKALAHLASCSTCQRQLGQLSVLADRLLLLAPQDEPGPGLEAAVLERAGVSERARRRRRRPARPPSA